ncbi:MAG: hypothetical protein RIS29_2240 [Bacteroidota bacterium]|jgi:NAD(P)H-hydrate epimerase
MKIFSTKQIQLLDQYTIKNEPIASIDLMERAALAIKEQLVAQFPSNTEFLIFAGPGNNGGDALAVARLLLEQGHRTQCILINTGKLSSDCATNLQRLKALHPNAISEQTVQFEAPLFNSETIIVDGLLGSGLSRSLSGIYADTVNWINSTDCVVVTIDIPSGLDGDHIIENNPGQTIIKADYTYTLQFPKLTFLLPETGDFVGIWKTLDIDLHPEAIATTPTNWYMISHKKVTNIKKERSKFSHKGTYGHALIVAGSKGMAGASVLAAKAAMKSGAGLVSVHGPGCNRNIVQTCIAEAIFISDKNKRHISLVGEAPNYKTVAFGPGIGTSADTAFALQDFLQNYSQPCVLDADALNLISQQPELIDKIPKGSILTPHPKEFERMFGKCDTSLDRINKASEIAQQYQFIIVLKGTYTAIALPNGEIHFNSTGNSGMATAGSGDVLTGILTALMAQGYNSTDAAIFGVYIHGLAGDCALEQETEETLIASDIIAHLSNAFVKINDSKHLH